MNNYQLLQEAAKEIKRRVEDDLFYFPLDQNDVNKIERIVTDVFDYLKLSGNISNCIVKTEFKENKINMLIEVWKENNKIGSFVLNN